MIDRSKPLVLVADDQVPTTVMLERVFDYEGFDVKSVHDGIAALETARELLPDLILLDIQMPGLNGFEVLEKLREIPETERIPTILITAMGETSDIVYGMNLGADDYVRKPFHPRELLARARSKMRARKLEDSLQQRTEELEAMLRVSDELNQHLEASELLELIVQLVLDMVPGQGAIVYQLDEDNQLIDWHAQGLDDGDHQSAIDKFIAANKVISWPDDVQLLPGFDYGVAIPLQYSGSGNTQGILIVVSEQPLSEGHVNLIMGIGHQANLALHNAELYKIQANSAQILAEKVEERTRELQSAHRMLVRSEKLASVGRLAASIAHEINNPLTPIKVNLDDMLEDVQAENPIDARDITHTLESVERITRVVSKLLEFTGKGQTTQHDARALDVNNIITNVHELVKKSFQHNGQTIDLDLQPLPQILGDKDGLEQVFMNLVLNASQAMPAGGKVTIQTYSHDDRVVIRVKDNGSGIPEDLRETIFEPFITTKDDGNGLGLFVSYGIIEGHDGYIEVESEVGKGTIFTVSLPQTDAVKSPSNKIREGA